MAVIIIIRGRQSLGDVSWRRWSHWYWQFNVRPDPARHRTYTTFSPEPTRTRPLPTTTCRCDHISHAERQLLHQCSRHV